MNADGAWNSTQSREAAERHKVAEVEIWLQRGTRSAKKVNAEIRSVGRMKNSSECENRHLPVKTVKRENRLVHLAKTDNMRLCGTDPLLPRISLRALVLFLAGRI